MRHTKLFKELEALQERLWATGKKQDAELIKNTRRTLLAYQNTAKDQYQRLRDAGVIK